MNDDLKLGRVLGIRVGLSRTLLALSVVFTAVLAGSSLPARHPGYEPVAYFLVAAVTTALLLASVLAHEIAHAVVARRVGLDADGITLWALGGFTRLRREPVRARDEFAVAAAGPAASAIAGGAAFLAATGARAVGASSLSVGALEWLVLTNLFLVGLNLVPVAPLDGGRLLRAAVWGATGSRARGITVAARAGQLLGSALIAVPVVNLLRGDTGLLWLVVVGWFIRTGAGASLAFERTRAELDGITVADVVDPDPVVVDPWETVGAVAAKLPPGGDRDVALVRGPDGRPQQVVTAPQLRRALAHDVADGAVGELAEPIGAFTTAAPSEALADALGRSRPGRAPLLIVWDDDGFVGLVTPSTLRDVRSLRSLLPLR